MQWSITGLQWPTPGGSTSYLSHPFLQPSRHVFSSSSNRLALGRASGKHTNLYSHPERFHLRLWNPMAIRTVQQLCSQGMQVRRCLGGPEYANASRFGPLMPPIVPPCFQTTTFPFWGPAAILVVLPKHFTQRQPSEMLPGCQPLTW